MAFTGNVFFGIGEPGSEDIVSPVVSKRDPTSKDHTYPIGQFWVNTSANSVWCLTSVVANGAVWTTSPASGVGTFASVDVTGGDLQLAAPGNIIVDGGDLTLSAGNASITGNLTVVGDLDVTGDFDINNPGAVSIISSANVAPSVLIEADGGTSEQVLVHSAQGTEVDSIYLLSDVGGLTLEAANLASADAIGLEATLGGINMDAALQVNIASSQDAADAIALVASAGGISIAATGAAGQDIDIVNTGGSVNITATENAAQAIYLRANGGTSETIQAHAAQGSSATSVYLLSDVGGITLRGGVASADAVNIECANAAGGVDIDAGTGGIAIDSTGAFSIDGAAASNVSVSGAGIDLTVSSSAGSLNISAGEADAAAVVIEASDAAGGLQIRAGSAGILIGNEADTAIIDVGDIAPTASRLITIGGGQVATAAVTDTIDIGVDGATTEADAEKIVNIGTGALDTGVNAVNIASGNVASGTHAVNVSTGTGTKSINMGNADGLTTINIDAIALINDSINVNTSINTGTSTGAVAIGNAAAGALSMDTAAGISLDAATASNFTVTGAADLTLASSAGSINISGGEDAADAVVISAGAGGISIAATGEAGQDIDIVNTGGSVNISATEDVAQAIYLRANGGTSETIQIHADQGTSATSVYLLSDVGGITLRGGVASADAVNIECANAAGGVDIDAGTGGIAIDSTGAFSIDGAAASNVSVSGAGIDLTVSSAAGSVIVQGAEAIASAVQITASDAAGGVDITAGTGGIDINAAGIVRMQPATATVAGTSLTIDANVGVATFTGLTTASAATETLTINNSLVDSGSAVLMTVSNIGSNDAQMTLTRVQQNAGSFTVQVRNNGAAALNGDIMVTFWIIAA